LARETVVRGKRFCSPRATRADGDRLDGPGGCDHFFFEGRMAARAFAAFFLLRALDCGLIFARSSLKFRAFNCRAASDFARASSGLGNPMSAKTLPLPFSMGVRDLPVRIKGLPVSNPCASQCGQASDGRSLFRHETRMCNQAIPRERVFCGSHARF
jgi:hypothetical protein